MPATRARTHGDTVEIPGELHDALGQPRRIVLTPAADSSIMLRGQRLRNRLGEPVRKLVGRDAGSFVAKLRRAGDPAAFTTRMPLSDAEYGIANYDVSYALLPIAAAPDADSREAFWGGVEDYHEHRELERQDPVAHRVSEWLAADVLAPLGSSFLELGCGAGRNLRALQRCAPDAYLHGVDISAGAIRRAAEHVPGADVRVGSLYELEGVADDSIDVVYTSGVLMHVPHAEVGGVVREMHRIARNAVVHFELHGPSHGFDFHRYPRDYEALYAGSGLSPHRSYDVYPPDDYRSTGLASFSHALLVARLGA
jgi:SAM-dependent methyltransferase